mmetsp:Transcript_2361/g.6223  ORF Transcript_2361/g.6223 Transcript_2361/m.6223 type:complete len:203 (+) Transcript_2361:3-611(+)
MAQRHDGGERHCRPVDRMQRLSVTVDADLKIHPAEALDDAHNGSSEGHDLAQECGPAHVGGKPVDETLLQGLLLQLLATFPFSVWQVHVEGVLRPYFCLAIGIRKRKERKADSAHGQNEQIEERFRENETTTSGSLILGDEWNNAQHQEHRSDGVHGEDEAHQPRQSGILRVRSRCVSVGGLVAADGDIAWLVRHAAATLGE